MTYEEVISRFDVKKEKNGKAYCICPCHNDTEPSLTISSKDGHIGVYCHAGCNTLDVLQSKGLNFSDLFVNSKNKRPKTWEQQIHKAGICPDGYKVVNVYNYTENSVVIASKIRYEAVIDGKRKKQDRWYDHSKGRWSKPDNKILIYNESALDNPNDTVIVCEGEKDCDTLERLGLKAITTGGATSWHASVSERFTGRQVLILRDNDKAGLKFAIEVYETSQQHASFIKCFNLSDREHGDVTDWIEDGHTREELLQIVKGNDFEKLSDLKQALEKEDKVTKFITFSQSLQDSPIKKQNFLVQSLLYEEGINLISGDPKTYKTYIAIDIAISIACGGYAFEQFKANKTGKVMFIPTEFDTRQRFLDLIKTKDIETDCLDNIILPIMDDLEFITWSKYSQYIVDAIKEHTPTLLVLDPLSYMFDCGDIKDNEPVLVFMRELKAIIKNYNTTVLLTHHNNRGSDTNKIHNVSGASAITRTADAIIYLESPKQDVEQNIDLTDEDINKQDKHIKLIKGPFRHGGEGYKYYQLTFQFDNEMTTLVCQRYDTKNMGNNIRMNTPKGEMQEELKGKILDALKEGTLSKEFKTDDVVIVVSRNSSVSETTLKRDIKKTLKNMVDSGYLSSKAGKGYTLISDTPDNNKNND